MLETIRYWRLAIQPRPMFHKIEATGVDLAISLCKDDADDQCIDEVIQASFGAHPGDIPKGKLIKTLSLRLQDDDKEVRRAAARILGRLGARQAIEPLTQALNDADPQVAAAARRALDTLNGKTQ